MDPQKTLTDLVSAATNHEADDVVRLALALIEWSDMGGFTPATDDEQYTALVAAKRWFGENHFGQGCDRYAAGCAIERVLGVV